MIFADREERTGPEHLLVTYTKNHFSILGPKTE